MNYLLLVLSCNHSLFMAGYRLYYVTLEKPLKQVKLSSSFFLYDTTRSIIINVGRKEMTCNKQEYGVRRALMGAER